MLFRYYFFKKGTGTYEQADLLSYLNSNPYIDIVMKNENERVAHYFNRTLGISADFVIANKSIVPGIERLDPSYIDVNIRVEFSVLLPSCAVSLIINICEDLCKLFNFYVYNEVFEDVSSFKRPMMLKAFDIVKQAYKKKFPENLVGYYRLDAEELKETYDYLGQIMILKDILKEEDVKVPIVTYYAVEGKRKVYTAIEVNLEEPFVFPSFVDMIHIIDLKKSFFISAVEFKQKVKKLFHVIEGSSNNLFYIGRKEMRKFAKIITKTDFSPLILELKEVEFKKVLDI